MQADETAAPLLAMTQAPDSSLDQLPPFSTDDLVSIDEPDFPLPTALPTEVPSEAAMVKDLEALRAKFDDGLIFCINMVAEKDRLAKDVSDATLELERVKSAPLARKAKPEETAAIAEFEAAFEEGDAGGGCGVIQVVVVVIMAFLFGYVSHQIPALIWDFIDASSDAGTDEAVEELLNADEATLEKMFSESKAMYGE